MPILIWLALMLWTGLAFGRDLTLPDPDLTPGDSVKITLHELCTKKWGKDRRHVTAAMKREVFESYGLQCKPLFQGSHLPACKNWEVDHLQSRELGGADAVKNLWPQAYEGEWNAHMKDRVENRLHKEVCTGNITLEQAQKEISTDWRIPYRRYFGSSKH
jgi:hypothetical protein